MSSVSSHTKLSPRDNYGMFLKSAHRALSEVTNNGVFISASKMRLITERLSQELQEQEQTFCRWASYKVGAVRPLDIHRRSKLRNLLFAPRRFQSQSKCVFDTVNSKCAAPTSGLYNPSAKERGKFNTEKNNGGYGLGLIPNVFVRNGSPSLSAEALQVVLDGVRVTSRYSGVHDTESVPALEALIRAKRLKTRVDKAAKALLAVGEMENRLYLQHIFDGQSVTPAGAWKELALGNDAVASISAQHGNRLIVLHFNRMHMWAIAQLSGCQNLRRRVENKSDTAAVAATLMYEGIRNEYRRGMPSLNNPNSGIDSDLTCMVEARFPVALSLAGRVDSAIACGGGVGGSSLIRVISGCSRREAQELRMRWYDGHSGVRRWHELWREKALEERIVETMMGQRFVLRGTLDQGKNMYANAEKTLTEGMRHVIQGTAIEAVMSIAIRLVCSIVLKNCGWRVILVTDTSIVLEGPQQSIDIAQSIACSDSAHPFDLRDPIRMNVEVETASCLGDLSRFPVEL